MSCFTDERAVGIHGALPWDEAGFSKKLIHQEPGQPALRDPA